MDLVIDANILFALLRIRFDENGIDPHVTPFMDIICGGPHSISRDGQDPSRTRREYGR
jgi:hypothetical protein